MLDDVPRRRVRRSKLYPPGDGPKLPRVASTDPVLVSVRTVFGRCCACGLSGATAVLLVQRKAPVPGTGWGCVQCDLPADGAIAVLCRPCSRQFNREHKPDDFIKQVCYGHATDDKRVALVECVEVFQHDLSRHPECQ